MMNTILAGTAIANPLLLHSDIVLPDSIFLHAFFHFPFVPPKVDRHCYTN